MVYKQKKSYQYNNRRNNSRAVACVQGYLNPFKDSIQNIKIPDGYSNLSCGLRNVIRDTITTDATTKNLTLVFSPNFLEVFHYAKHTGDTPTSIAKIGSTVIQNPKPVPVAQIEYWRIVSQAFRIMTTQNSDKSEGWFEAIRVASDHPYNFEYSISGVGLATNPSYVNGKLKDIHRYLFQLKPIGVHHHFMPLRNEAGDNSNQCADRQFDTIIVCIHGCAPSSSFLLHGVQNAEYQFDENSDLVRFMDGSVSDLNGLHRAQALLMSSVKAATVSGY